MRTKILLILVLVLTLLATSVVSAKAPVHQVSGGGKYEPEVGPVETYGFVAQLSENGDVSGKGTVHIKDQLIIHFDVNCLVVDGNTAWMGFVVTKSSEPEVMPVGFDFTWQFQDNGEGANAPPDLQSWAWPNIFLPGYGLGTDCNDQGDLFSFAEIEWQAGNIQIR